MKRLSIFLVIIALMLQIVLPGCGVDSEDSRSIDERKAAEYVKSKGFKIVSYLGEGESYTLDREMMVREPYMSVWIVQRTEPNLYFGKTVIFYNFVVTNHPLEKKYAAIYASNDYESRKHYAFRRARHWRYLTASQKDRRGNVRSGLFYRRRNARRDDWIRMARKMGEEIWEE